MEGRVTAGRTRPAPLLLTNLLNDLETLSPLLVERIAAGDALDAFLLAAGMQQVVEDHLHRDPLFLDRAAARLRRRLPAPWGRVAAGTARLAAGLLWQGMVRAPGQRAAAAWLAGLDPLVERLAAALTGPPTGADLHPLAPMEVEARRLLAGLSRLPSSVRLEPLRLPSCFRSFDQAPEDIEVLVERFARRWPQPERPLLVCGIRTSGSYLAALASAWLRGRGYRAVRTVTLRPGQRWLGREAGLVRRVVDGGGLVLVVDDPPRSWGSVARVVRELRRLGAGEDRVVLLLATFDDAAAPPPALRGCPAVLLPLAEWAISRRLEPESARESLAGLLAGRAEVVGLRFADGLGPGGARGHLQAAFEVELRAGGRTSRRVVRARGVGLGYLGAHALAVAARLDGRVTTVHGLDAGLLFEDSPPPAARLHEPLAAADAAAVAGYVAHRSRALALAGDPARRLRHRGAAWQWAGQALGGLLGRASELGRPLGMAVARRVLRVSDPAVVDNRTQLSAFARQDGGPGTLVKSDFDHGVFGSDDLTTFDPASDVALAAASAADATTGNRLRRAYEAASGRPVEPERWLLCQLVHVLVAQEGASLAERRTDPRPARLVQRYYAEVLLADVEPAGSGPLCALDLDGVLETMELGFPATSPAGARALRALARHGCRPVLATGRSVDEVRDRCAAYGLAGGVAEYGGALYLHRTGEVRPLQRPADRGALERLRAALAESNGVHLDPAYRHSVRAFRLDAGGRRRGLSGEAVERALESAGTGGRLRAVRGHYQTDFTTVATGKAAALRVLAAELGAADVRPFALAVGDTGEDLEMMRLAALAVAPANAERAVRSAAGVTVARRPAQAGLAEAVTRLLGHRPGACEACAPLPLSASSRLLLDLLELPDLRRPRQAVRALRLLLACRDRG